MTGQVFLQQLTDAISLGSLYALIAIGYTMVYGILRLINFAHGEIFMMGSFVALYAINTLPIPWYLSLVGTVVLIGVMGMILERLAYKPLRGSKRITILISAVGASFLLQNLALLLFGGRPKAFPTPQVFNKVIALGSVSVNLVSIIIPITTFVLLFVLNYVLKHTKTGIAMRALSSDYDTVSLMGVDVNRVISFTFFIGSALAAVGGVLWSVKYPSLLPTMGAVPGIKCFIAAVIGGIGNITGAVIGGFMLGMIEIMLIWALPSLTGYRDAFAFVLLIVILLVKPTGIMGETIAEKV